jgi:tRNA nucleotidyltransferase (CCA-adding enzyme)
MLLSELLNILGDMARKNGLSEPYVVGGLPRDKLFGIAAQVRDIDITTGDKGSFALAMLASKEWPDAQFRSYDDGHSSLDFKNIRLDFSNNFVLPGIETELVKMGIPEPTVLQMEVFSRDFTVNTILQPMDLGRDPLDITGRAFDDARDKVLRTPVNPELTIGYDPRRILRAVKIALKFGLTVDQKLKDAMIKYRGGLSTLPLSSIKRQVNQMLKMDSQKSMDMLSEYKLLPIIPLSRLMTAEIAKKHMIQSLLEG